MSKVLIVAQNKTTADVIAKMHNLRPWDWRYCFNARDLHGRTKKDTVFLDSGWIDHSPEQEMSLNLRILRDMGVDIVMVST